MLFLFLFKQRVSQSVLTVFVAGSLLYCFHYFHSIATVLSIQGMPTSAKEI